LGEAGALWPRHCLRCKTLRNTPERARQAMQDQPISGEAAYYGPSFP
jgi:hypothetical protein